MKIHISDLLDNYDAGAVEISVRPAADVGAVKALVREKLEKEAQKPMGKKKHIKTLLIAAVVVLLLAITAFAVHNLWSTGMSEYFGADEQAQSAMLEEGMTQLPEEAVYESENFTVTLEQSLYTGNSLFLMLRYETEAGFDAEACAELFGGGNMLLYPAEGGEPLLSMSGGFVDGGCLVEFWDYRDQGLEGFTSGTVRLAYEVYGGEGENPLLESWSVDFTPELDNSLRLNGRDFTPQIHGVELPVQNLTVTPVSVSFRSDASLWEELEIRQGIWLIFGEARLKDGSSVPFSTLHCQALEGAEPGVLEAVYTFETAIADLTQVESIVLLQSDETLCPTDTVLAEFSLD